MCNIKVGRYQGKIGWRGRIEPEDGSWVMFIRDDGIPVVFLNRDPVTGAVI